VRSRLRGLGLVAPLLGFLTVFFVVPVATMLSRSVEDDQVSAVFPRTLTLLESWDGAAPPDEITCAALVDELLAARGTGGLGEAAKRLNYDVAGLRSMLLKTARKASKRAGPWREALLAMDARWGQPEAWAALRRARGPHTLTWLAAAVDLHRDTQDTWHAVPEDRAIHLNILGRTFWVSLQVTVLCLLLGYPLAYVLAHTRPSRANLLMVLVLLPFWTSLLVRTTAWIVLLQPNGVVNGALRALGLIDAPLELVFNRVGVLVAMTHILLPFMVLPLYSVMRGVPGSITRAARSLGATPWTAFARIYAPQTLPGVAAGGLLVFILSIGYYITPALVGGPRDQLLSYFVALHTNQTLNWGLASALGAVLLVGTLLIYAVFQRVVGVDRLRVS
jgi:putative spermidine/putrescine transport system permease protein